MFPLDTLITYIGTVLLIVIAPGPDNILAISRGLSQGSSAAAVSAFGAGLGIMFHTIAAVLGLTLLFQAFPSLFWAIKLVGAAYLVWVGIRAIRSRDLIAFHSSKHLHLRRVFMIGFLSNVLNPKPGLFVLAFIPQFVAPSRGSAQVQMLVYGGIFAVLTFLLFTALGCCARQISTLIFRHPRIIAASNIAAGTAFIVSGLSVLAIGRWTT